MRRMLPYLALATLFGCAEPGSLPDEHVLEPLSTSESTDSETSESVEVVQVADDDFVLTELDSGTPEVVWLVNAGAYQWVTFRLVAEVDLTWSVIAPDGLLLDIYEDGDDEVTHGKTDAYGGIFEVVVALPDGVDEAEVELLIEREAL